MISRTPFNKAIAYTDSSAVGSAIIRTSVAKKARTTNYPSSFRNPFTNPRSFSGVIEDVFFTASKREKWRTPSWFNVERQTRVILSTDDLGHPPGWFV